MEHFNVWEIQEHLYTSLKRYNVLVLSEGPESEEARSIRENVETVLAMLHDLKVRASVLWDSENSLCYGICIEARYKRLGAVLRGCRAR